MIIKGIEYSLYQPSRTDVAWAKPVKGGFALYLYFNGKWQPHVLMDDKGSDSPEDDQEADISNIPQLVEETVEQVLPEVIGDTVEQEVAKQMDVHDVKVDDVHFEGSGDLKEYPDYSDIIQG